MVYLPANKSLGPEGLKEVFLSREVNCHQVLTGKDFIGGEKDSNEELGSRNKCER